MQGMEREESSDEGAFPDFPGHCREEPEQKKRAQDVQNQIREVVSSGIETVKFIIEHQGQPGQGMPEFRVGGAEGPDDALRRDAGLNVMVVCDIDIVVNIDKVKFTYLQKNSKRDNSEKDIYDEILFLLTDIHLIKHTALLLYVQSECSSFLAILN